MRAGGGSARDTLSVLDQLIAGAGPDGVSYARAVALLGVTDVTLIDEMCDALAAGDGAAAYATIDRVAEAGHDPRRFASDLLERFRDLIVLQQVPDAVTKGLIDGPADQLEAMAAQATRLGPATLSRCADIVHNGLVEMRGTTAPRLLLELITARMLLPGAEDSTGALLQRLERMERRLTLSADTGENPNTVRGSHEPVIRSGGAPTGEIVEESRVGGPSGSVGSGLSAARAAAGRRGNTAQVPPVGRAPASAPHVEVPPVGRASASAPHVEVALVERAPAETPRVEDPLGSGPASSTEPLVASASQPHEAADVEGRDLDGSGRSPQEPVSGRAADPAEGEAQRVGEGEAASTGRSVPQARSPVPADAPPAVRPESTDVATVAAGLSIEAVREVWPEIITAVARKTKKIAALASGATLRELDGETVVLTFRFPAHAKMVAAEPSPIVEALYEALGGHWQIRCDVSGEAGGVAPGPGVPDRRSARPPASDPGARPPQDCRADPAARGGRRPDERCDHPDGR